MDSLTINLAVLISVCAVAWTMTRPDYEFDYFKANKDVEASEPGLQGE